MPKMRDSPAKAFAEAVDNVGGTDRMAALLDVTKQAISKWKREGEVLPVNRVLNIEMYSGVRRERLRPDIYPPAEAPEPPAPTERMPFDPPERKRAPA